MREKTPPAFVNGTRPPRDSPTWASTMRDVVDFALALVATAVSSCSPSAGAAHWAAYGVLWSTPIDCPSTKNSTFVMEAPVAAAWTVTSAPGWSWVPATGEVIATRGDGLGDEP